MVSTQVWLSAIGPEFLKGVEMCQSPFSHRILFHPFLPCTIIWAIGSGACVQADRQTQTTGSGPDVGGRPCAGARAAGRTTGEPPPGGIWLETLDLGLMVQDWGSPRAGRSVDNNPLRISGRTFEHGIGTHSNSEWIIDLKGAARTFRAVVGVDDEIGVGRASIVFVVLVDGREVKRTGLMRSGDEPIMLEVDVSGAGRMILVVEDGGDGIDYDHADWGDAMLVLASDAVARPEAVRAAPEPPPAIARGAAPEPAIHAPRVVGGTPGRAFLFRVPATGEPPLRFSSSDLPLGLKLDTDTGIISGVLADERVSIVDLAVEGPRGRAASKLTIVAAPKSLALTPPMGWNSWNVWGTSVDDAKVRAAADWMVKSGLAAHGYQYINIDDAWEGERDADGRLQTNEKFPDMKALADYVHSKGLKLGIYSSPGPKTCAGYEGSYQHEMIDARTWAEWGIDLVKYDWCSYGQIATDDSLAELQKPYHVMREALDACGRDIVYSLCQYGMGRVSEWGAKVGGNYWRTTGDIIDTWASLSGIGFGQNGLEVHAGPGHWNDPDMLVVGKLGWGPTIRDTRLTPNEQITHLTLWSLLASPLLIGCDLSQMDEFTVAVLTNPEVLEVNQDPLGRQAARVAVVGSTEVWMRLLLDGTVAVGLFNRGRDEARVTANWSDLRLSGNQPVRNLWQRRDEGTFDGAFSATVPRHGAVMLKIGTLTAG